MARQGPGPLIPDTAGGKRNAGKQVTVIVEDTHFRILYECEGLAVKQRRNPGPVKRIKVISRREVSQAKSSIS